jgi:16S rRNA (cytidine1402-2'-O)-methyltransferase
MGTLYLVATPIGNLDDITFRALDTLRHVRLIAAEDTRHAHKLLSKYSIQATPVSYHEHNKLVRLDRILKALEEGDVALISDAGTPALNDPGYELVRAVLEAGHTVSPIPGPSAPLAALVASGLPTDAFLYLGYPPRRAGERHRFLKEARDQPYTLVFLETPRRLLGTLQDMLVALGDRRIAVARELTKIYEEIFRGLVSQALEHFSAAPPRGEFTLVVEGSRVAPSWTEEQVRLALKERLAAQGSSEMEATPAQVAAQIASLSGWPRRLIYRMITEDPQGLTHTRNNHES